MVIGPGGPTKYGAYRRLVSSDLTDHAKPQATLDLLPRAGGDCMTAVAGNGSPALNLVSTENSMIRAAAEPRYSEVPVRHLVGNTLAQFATPGLRTLMGLVLAATLSRFLGVAGFGEYALVFAYVAVFTGVLTDWGLGTVCLREISQHPERRASLIGSCVALQASIAFASYVVMLLSLIVLPYPSAVRLAIALYGLTMLLTPLDLLGLPFQAELRVVRLLPASLVATLVNFTLVMALVALRGPLVILVGGSLVSILIQYAWVTHLGLRALGGAIVPTRAHWHFMLKESWPLAVSTVVSTALQQAPLLALSLVSLQAVGLFNAANKIMQQLFILPLAVRTTTFPLLAASWVRDRRRFVAQLDRLVRVSLLISIPGAILGIGIATPLMRMVFGPAFGSASVPFALLMAVFAIMFPGILLGEALIATGFQRLSLSINAASLPLLLVLLAVLTPAGGASGAALALLCSYASMVAAVFVVAWRRLGLTSLGPTLLQSAMGFIAGLLTLKLATGAGPVTAAVLGALAAGGTLILLGRSTYRGLIQSLTHARRTEVVPFQARPITSNGSRKHLSKVALVYPIPFGDEGVFGGGERYAVDLATALSKQVDTVLVTMGGTRRTLRRGRLTVEVYPYVTLLRGVRQNPLAVSFLASLRTVDVIHCLIYRTLVTDLSVLFGRLAGKRVFITDVGGGSDLSLARVLDVTRLAHGLLLISQRAAEEFRGGQRSREVIYAGVDIDRFRVSPYKRERRVLYVGRLLPHKGINYLIEAVDPTIPLTIAGRPYDARYYATLRELAVGKDVTFITDASDEEIIRLYQTSAVSVLPSVHRTIYGDYSAVPELLGFSLMEAMACETPVVCTDSGSLREVVTDGIDGFVVPPNRPDLLRERIFAVLEDPKRAEEMGVRARLTITRKFTWQNVAERCLAAYERAR
jgi:O-antigen/teichoic acid export membrane protein/glycosyltransferase involved in cell wall biosynthesis